ncbi:hypothetical protein NQ314_009733 [Rhamnusium bicolor]|uniref:Cuticle protein n=1 Tax=Rhamnusium bicolor TaxID=1586634 RepID=A0AAV8XWX5_9CUCU|nr:hypothetical protein NQ314_009733 [Rhamnusium bicolor]
MMFVILTVLVAAANAGFLGAPLATTYASSPLGSPLAYHAPLAYSAPIAKAVVSEEYDSNPQYSYGYDVQDALTGDNKNQYETRNGDVVQGSYSLVEPDGTRRTVEYNADPINGFNSVVHKEPLIAAPAVAKVAAPFAYAAPVARFASPLAYAAPIAKYGAPLAYSSSLIH